MWCRLFGTRPGRKCQSPLEKGDHPEMDTLNLLDSDGTQFSQSLIRVMNLVASLTRMIIATAAMHLSGATSWTCWARQTCLWEYLTVQDAAIFFRTSEPDYSSLPEQNFDWMSSVFGNDRYLIPPNIAEARGKPFRITHDVGTNLW